MFEAIGSFQHVGLSLYTDAYVIRGSVETRQRRITDILNQADQDFLVISEVVFEEFGSHAGTIRSDFAQVNLESVLFAVASDAVEVLPELRTRKIAEQALISVPPFKITGRIHLLPERGLRDALTELTGRFIPVTDAVYWSDVVGEARTQAEMVAFNHGRAQILAPHHEVDPWTGLDRHAAAEAEASSAAAAAEASSAADSGTPPVDFLIGEQADPPRAEARE